MKGIMKEYENKIILFLSLFISFIPVNFLSFSKYKWSDDFAEAKR